MSLNNISLPPTAIAGLYSKSLVETGETVLKSTETESKNFESASKQAVISSKGIRYLGDNNKKVLIIVNSPDAVHLPDKELQFLTNMLTACQLSLADVAIVNINNQTLDYKELLKELKSRSALLFDIEPSGLGLPMSFPFFQIQPYAGCSFLYVPALKDLEEDKVQKSKLWVSLRRLFNI